MKVLERLLAGSVTKLTRVACMLALVGLALMSYSILDPRAIPVIVAMSVGHAFGIGAFGCYLLAVILDIKRSGRASLAPPPGPSQEPLQSDADAAAADSPEVGADSKLSGNV